MLKVNYKFDDKGIRDILSGVSRMTSSRIRVGVVGPGANNKHPTSDLTAWEIGALQEFGSDDGHIPERSFIRSTLADVGWVKQTVAQAARRVVSGRSNATEALNWAGNIFASAIKRQIMSGVGPRNADTTVRWKGHDHTLIGLTRTLFEGIAHEIIHAVI